MENHPVMLLIVSYAWHCFGSSADLIIEAKTGGVFMDNKSWEGRGRAGGNSMYVMTIRGNGK